MDRRSFVRRAAAVGLAVATPGLRRALAAPISSAEVRGHVVSGKRPLSGVRVSDGYQVVATDDAGKFRLRVGPNSGPFVFVTTPRGFWTDAFYVPTSSAAAKPPVFRLKPTEQSDDYRALYITDVHLTEGQTDQSVVRLQATIDEINRMDPLPAFCWMGGDITLQGGRGRQYVELFSRLKTPVRNGVGNHEMLVKQTDPRCEFQQLFGPTYYSFDVGRVHYVTLDGCHVNLGQQGYRNVEGRLSQQELHWLAEDLRSVPDGVTTVVAIHIPLVSDYPARRGTTAKKAPYWVVQNADQVIELLAQHPTSLVVQGHLHENQRLTRKNIEFVESISVSGTWWKATDGRRENGVSGEPRGYRVIETRGSKVQHRYQSSAESRVDVVGEIVGRPARLPAGKNAELHINVFDAGEQARVFAGIDEDRLERLRPSSTSIHYAGLHPAHHWLWLIPAAELTPGKHSLKVRVEEPGRETGSFEHVVTA